MRNTLIDFAPMIKNRPLLISFLALFFVNIAAQYFIDPHSEVFDSSLFFLQMLYPTVGLIPYVDFISIYPFGISFFSLMINKMSFGALSLFDLVFFVHFLLQLMIIKKLIELAIEKDKILFITLLLSVETIVYAKLGAEPFSHLLVILFLFNCYNFITYKKNYLSVLGFACLLIFVRWDRLFYAISTMSFFYLYFYKNQLSAVFFVRLTSLFIFPILLLIVSLFLLTNDSFYSSLSNIFIDPFIITKQRNLPFSSTLDVFAIPYYILLASYFFLLSLMIKGRINQGFDYFLFFGSLCLLPQTFGRPDIAHLIPFYFSSSLLLLLSFVNISKVTKFIFFFGYSALIGLVVWAVFSRNLTYDDTCSPYLNNYQAKSIYVGNLSYKNFFVNYVYLYYKNFHIKPGTRYIADEPGIQNNLFHSNQIISDLQDAQRPLIIFQNLSHFIDKKDNSVFVTSDNIVKYINNNAVSIGTCFVNNYFFDVKVSY